MFAYRLPRYVRHVCVLTTSPLAAATRHLVRLHGHACVTEALRSEAARVRRKEDDGTYVVLYSSCDHKAAPIKSHPWWRWHSPVRMQARPHTHINTIACRTLNQPDPILPSLTLCRAHACHLMDRGQNLIVLLRRIPTVPLKPNSA